MTPTPRDRPRGGAGSGRPRARSSRSGASAQAGAVVAVEVLVEEQLSLPGRVGLQPLDAAEAGPAAVRPDEEDRDQASPQIGGDHVEGDSWLPDPVGYSTVRSSPKNRGSAPAR